METNIKTEARKTEEILLESHHDEYWEKEYEISHEDLQKTGDTDIVSLIVESGKRHKVFNA
jgi:hypothetical protein